MENLYYFAGAVFKIGIVLILLWIIRSPEKIRARLAIIYPTSTVKEIDISVMRKQIKEDLIKSMSMEITKEPSLPYALAFNAIKIKGMDVSHYQGSLLNDTSPSEELSFVMVKATEGSNITDPKFATNWRSLEEKGIVRGAYHFYCTTSSPEAQADFFISTVQKLNQYDLPPILDIENDGINNSVSKTKLQLQDDLLTWLYVVEEEMGKVPMIYTSVSFYKKYLSDPLFESYPIWIAYYTEDGQSYPEPEKIADIPWQFWQYTDTKRNESVLADQNIFNGNNMKSFTQFILDSNTERHYD